MPLSTVGTAGGGREPRAAGPATPARTVRRCSTVPPPVRLSRTAGGVPPGFADAAHPGRGQTFKQQTLAFALSHWAYPATWRLCNQETWSEPCLRLKRGALGTVTA